MTRRPIALAVLAIAHVAAADPPKQLHVMTYNVEFNNPAPKISLDAIAGADADVVLLQEVSADWARWLDARFATQYPHRAYHTETRGAAGIAVLSKLPIETDELLQPPSGGWFVAERLVITGPFGPVQMLNVHLRPANDGGWVRGFFTTRAVREREAAAYVPELARDLPTLVAGDFNEPPDGRAVAYLQAHGFAIANAKGPPTWHLDPLVFDLDRVMIDKHLAAGDGRVLDAGTSDHRPVIVTIATAR
ncbi:MAG TPA: endonuclease/exonuclease/phosphatase family protein [Kofleriaceae bacterium]|nr:endonuclease/exonuclease/phosphatase family protein [Kofleriaceae bacterium]